MAGDGRPPLNHRYRFRTTSSFWCLAMRVNRLHEIICAYYLSRDLVHEDKIGCMTGPSERGAGWTLLSGHGHVLVEIYRNPGARMRDISAVVDLTERTVQAIVADLVAAGYVNRTRTGRRNFYAVNPAASFRHQSQDGLSVGPFLQVLTASVAATGHEPTRRSAPQTGHGDAGSAEPGSEATDSEPAH